MTIDEVQSKAYEELFLVVLSLCKVFALMIWWIIKVMQVTTTFTTFFYIVCTMYVFRPITIWNKYGIIGYHMPLRFEYTCSYPVPVMIKPIMCVKQ